VTEEERALLLWDGGCTFCRRCVARVRTRDAAGRIRALPWQEAPSPPMTEAIRARCESAVVLILPGGDTLDGGRACLAVLGLLGWRRTAAILSAPPLVWAVEAGYRLVARNRNRLGRFF